MIHQGDGWQRNLIMCFLLCLQGRWLCRDSRFKSLAHILKDAVLLVCCVFIFHFVSCRGQDASTTKKKQLVMAISNLSILIKLSRITEGSLSTCASSSCPPRIWWMETWCQWEPFGELNHKTSLNTNKQFLHFSFSFDSFYPTQNRSARFVMVVLEKIKKAQLFYLSQIHFGWTPTSVYGKTAALFSPKICMPKDTAVIWLMASAKTQYLYILWYTDTGNW